MALVVCPECSKQISDRAAACPSCGCPLNSSASVSESPRDNRGYITKQSNEIFVQCPGKWVVKRRGDKQVFKTPCAIEITADGEHQFSAMPKTQTDAALLAELFSIRQLSRIMLLPIGSNNGIANECLAAISNFVHVKEISLTGFSKTYSNGSLTRIVSMHWLEKLFLIDGCERITDLGVVQLAALQNLKLIDFHGTSVSGTGESFLRSRLPTCVVTNSSSVLTRVVRWPFAAFRRMTEGLT